jgi:hypothetical protein
MQFQFEREMGTIRLRFLVENPDALFNEYRQRGVECAPNGVSRYSVGDARIRPLRLGRQRGHLLPRSDKRGEGAAVFVVCRSHIAPPDWECVTLNDDQRRPVRPSGLEPQM